VSTTDPTVQFFQYDIPALEAGSYTLTVTQHAADTRANPAFDETFAFVRTIAVSGDRFTVEGSHLGAVFPPTGSGEFGQCLPHVTCVRPTLPWERAVQADSFGTPWLAVLLFDSETYPPPPLQSLTVADLARSQGSLPAATASYADADAAFAPELGESWTDPLHAIDVDRATFCALAPTLLDLPLLAHARKLIEASTDDDPLDDPGHVSLIVGNRAIESDATGTRSYTAHLVSLEGLGPFLPNAAGDVPAALAAFTAVRLISLRSWSFVSHDPAETFAGYFDNAAFSTGPLTITAPAPTSAPPPTTLNAALAQGYLPVNQHTRLGERSIAWYRGPCVPYATAQPAIGDPNAPEGAATADALLRYDDADTAMFDASYAAAWQLGRLLALRDTAFSQALYDWKRQAADASAQAALHAAVTEALGLETTSDVRRIAAELIAAIYAPETLGAHPR
jgi:hypothetical protein